MYKYIVILFFSIINSSMALSGYVLDNLGNALPGVKLHIQGPAINTMLYTGSDGKYSLQNLSSSASYIIKASKSGYSNVERSAIGNANNININLIRQVYQLAGKVIDADGQAVSGVTVRSNLNNSAVTDASGEFRFNFLSGTRYILSGEYPDSFIESVTGTLNGNTSRVLLKIDN